jgi:hypothetical protein
MKYVLYISTQFIPTQRSRIVYIDTPRILPVEQAHVQYAIRLNFKSPHQERNDLITSIHALLLTVFIHSFFVLCRNLLVQVVFPVVDSSIDKQFVLLSNFSRQA